MSNYVIIGSGVASLAAAKAIREKDKSGSILILGKENVLPYSRPILSKSSLLNFDPDNLSIYSESWFEENNICLKLGASVKSVSFDDKTVVTCEGESFAYDKLILASGASAFVPDIKGTDAQEVFSVRNISDIQNIKANFKASTNAVVIGGGVIGLELAMLLKDYGAKVRVLEFLPYLMSRQLDEETSLTLQKRFSDLGIEVLTGADVESINSIDGHVKSVILKDGTSFDADLVVISCGVKANLDFLNLDEIDTNRFIVIDDHGRTSVKDVFACGDVVELNGMNYALVSQAMETGRVAGLNASGEDAKMDSFDTSVVMTTPGFGLFASGDLGKNPNLKYEVKVFDSKEDPAFSVNPVNASSVRREYYVNGKLVGVSLVGNLSKMYELKEKLSKEND